jgi:hypothetical protein
LDFGSSLKSLEEDRMYSANDALALSDRLVKFLKRGVHNTHGQEEWTQRNFELLRAFAEEIDAQSYPSAKNAPPEEKAKQFLWDFIAHQPDKGISIAVESEHNSSKKAILEDFEKLLYVRSPVKLMMCRVAGEPDALRIRGWAQKFMEQKCTRYSPGEVFVLYCLYWSGEGLHNRDFAFRLQVKGEIDYRKSDSEKFEHI